MTKQHQALITELTAQQAAAIQGGFGFRLDSLEVIQGGGDFGSGDDPLVNVNGTKVFSRVNVSAGDVFSINKTFALGNASSLDITLSDDDDDDDDLIQSLSFTGTGTVNEFFQNDFSSYFLSGEILP
jgi:hypothetical protein